MDNRKLACRIAEVLFTDGRGERARRLVMESETGKLGAGWIESAVARVIEEHLDAQPTTEKKRTSKHGPYE